MADTTTPAARIHRVTTRRRTLRPLNCPLEPELLVAEFAGELPPDVATAVRQHVAVCELCGTRSRMLQAPYALLESLGHEPVPYVPDLRDRVRNRAHARRALRFMTRLTASIGRSGTIALTALGGLLAILLLIAGFTLLPGPAPVLTRSTNTLTPVPAAASGGWLFAVTNKLVTISDHQGGTWQVAEVIAANERNGQIARSFPASGAPLRAGQPQTLPVGVAKQGNTIVEVTAPRADGSQAIVGFDATSGALRFVTRLTLPDGAPLPRPADALVLAPDGSVAYVGIADPHPAQGGVRVLTVDPRDGAIQAALMPSFERDIPMPPAPGGLPISAFPTSIPHLNAGGYGDSLALNGTLAISPDGRWLFDVLTLVSPQGQRYAVVRRMDAITGAVAQELALPGDFSIGAFGASPSTSAPQLYLAHGSPDAVCDILSADAQGPMLVGTVMLGGPTAPPDATFQGTLALMPAANGARLDIAQNVTQTNGSLQGHDLWEIDTQASALLVHRAGGPAVTAVLPNSLAGATANTFAVQGGTIALIGSDLSGADMPWLQLNDQQPVIALLGTSR